MKATFKNSFLLFIGSLLFLSSCKKDEVKALLNPSGGITLTATQTTLVLVQANGANTAVSFAWDKANFGFAAGINYTLQLAKGGTNFATATSTSVNMETALASTFTVKDLNAKMQDIIPYGSAQQVEARIKADVGSNVDPIYSNVLTMTITSYRDIVNYAFPQALWIAGNFQGWSPSTAPKIVDKFASGTTGSGYDGYINFTNASPAFKMVKGPDWPFGDFGTGATPGTLGSNGDLTLSNGAGVYRLTANTAALTWSATKINSWGLTGSSTPLGWPSGPDGTPGQDHDMTFNATDGTWSVTMNLTVGVIKFRANDAWSINFGDNSPVDNKPDYGGSDIPITVAGNYTVTLDIGVAGNYAYSIRKN